MEITPLSQSGKKRTKAETNIVFRHKKEDDAMSRWRNNGVWNKSHGQVEQTPRIDSFELATTEGWSGILCGGKWLETLYTAWDDSCEMFPSWSPGGVEIDLSRKPNGYGGQQLFFLCPACGRRVRYLYQVGAAFLCRKCSQLNYKSQQETRSGSMYYYEKGMKLVEDHLETWPRASPDGFSFCGWIPDRPRYMHDTTYRRYLRRFAKYQDLHQRRQLEDMARILRLFK